MRAYKFRIYPTKTQEKELWERQHNCPSCGLSLDRDVNAAINLLKRATAGTAGSNASGNVAMATPMKEEAIFLSQCRLG